MSAQPVFWRLTEVTDAKGCGGRATNELQTISFIATTYSNRHGRMSYIYMPCARAFYKTTGARGFLRSRDPG